MRPYYEHGGITIYHGDCRDVLPTYADASAGLVFFDPPYGLGVAEWDDALGCIDIVPCLKGLLRDGGSMYVTCSAHILAEMLRVIGPDRVISWCKPNIPMRKNLSDWEWSTEFVLRAVNGSKPIPFNKPHGEDGRDYWRIPVENGFLNRDSLTHPARKPLALLLRIASASTHPRDLVIDPMCGSGTTLVAAKRLGRKAIGIELDERYCEMASRRLSQGALDLFGGVA